MSNLCELPIVTVLGDSRVFDTYYFGPAYGKVRYGYQKTFASILKRMMLAGPNPSADVIHIPDHFRGRTVENNLLRLALTDPDAVILVDGIWETLLDRKELAAWAKAHGRPADASAISEAELLTLYVGDCLTLSPNRYASRIGRIVSYFSRRRRHVVWCTTPVTPRGHLGGLHYAGAYQTLPGWPAILEAMNATVRPVAESLGATILDLDALMRETGGAGACLIDQWHFSELFHKAIAERLHDIVSPRLSSAPKTDTPSGSLSFFPDTIQSLGVVLIGSAAERRDCKLRLPHLPIEAEIETPDNASQPSPHLLSMPAGRNRDLTATALLERLPVEAIVLYPEDFEAQSNPPGSDRAQYGMLT